MEIEGVNEYNVDLGFKKEDSNEWKGRRKSKGGYIEGRQYENMQRG